MVKVGWCGDRILIGGTELSANALKAAAPEWVSEIVDCPAQKRPPKDIDLFVVESCVTYREVWTDVFYDTPVVARISDQWPFGSPVLKRWILDKAKLLTFNSPIHHARFHYEVNAPFALVPAPVDMDRFRQAAQDKRLGNVYVGRVEPAKGTHLAIDWALRTGEPLRLYGKEQVSYIPWKELPENIVYCGELAYDQVPQVLGAAERFVFFPVGLESFGRVVAEAYAAGCELVMEGDIGALWWLANDPDAIQNAPQLFWEKVRDAIHV